MYNNYFKKECEELTTEEIRQRAESYYGTLEGFCEERGLNPNNFNIVGEGIFNCHKYRVYSFTHIVKIVDDTTYPYNRKTVYTYVTANVINYWNLQCRLSSILFYDPSYEFRRTYVPRTKKYKNRVSSPKYSGILRTRKFNNHCETAYPSFPKLRKRAAKELLHPNVYWDDFRGSTERGWKRTKKRKQWMKGEQKTCKKGLDKRSWQMEKIIYG